MDKVEAWERRGRKPLSVEEVENVLNKHPFLPVPKELVILDGVVGLPENGTAVGATPRANRDIMILTPLSNRGTVVHEAIHGLGLGEFAAYGITPMLMVKESVNLGLLNRNVKFGRSGDMSEPELKQRFGMVSNELMNEIQVFHSLQKTDALSNIKRYNLIQ